MSKPSLNSPTLIFLMAILRPVATSLPVPTFSPPLRAGISFWQGTCLCIRQHTFLLRFSVLSSISWPFPGSPCPRRPSCACNVNERRGSGGLNAPRLTISPLSFSSQHVDGRERQPGPSSWSQQYQLPRSIPSALASSSFHTAELHLSPRAGTHHHNILSEHDEIWIRLCAIKLTMHQSLPRSFEGIPKMLG